MLQMAKLQAALKSTPITTLAGKGGAYEFIQFILDGASIEYATELRNKPAQWATRYTKGE